jgi:hypothetical protein
MATEESDFSHRNFLHDFLGCKTKIAVCPKKKKDWSQKKDKQVFQVNNFFLKATSVLVRWRRKKKGNFVLFLPLNFALEKKSCPNFFFCSRH